MDARLGGDFLESPADLLDIEGHVLYDVLDMGEMLLPFRFCQGDTGLDGLGDDILPLDVLFIRILAADAVDDMTAPPFLQDVGFAKFDEIFPFLFGFFALGLYLFIGSLTVLQEGWGSLGKDSTIIGLPSGGDDGCRDGIGRKLQRPVFSFEDMHCRFEDSLMALVFGLLIMAGSEIMCYVG